MMDRPSKSMRATANLRSSPSTPCRRQPNRRRLAAGRHGIHCHCLAVGVGASWCLIGHFALALTKFRPLDASPAHLPGLDPTTGQLDLFADDLFGVALPR